MDPMRHQQFGEEHVRLRDAVRRFVESEVAPHAEAWDEQGEFPRALFRRMGELGFLGVRVPEQYGGAGLDWWYTVAYVEGLSYSNLGGFNLAMLVQSDIATPVIDALGSEEHKRQFLVPAVRGDWIGALGVSEPDAGSDVAALRTTARRDGDHYVINGSKLWITNGARADFIVLLVKTDPAAGHAGISMILFPTTTPGFSVGRKLRKMGNHASDTAELHFEECRVPVANLLAAEGTGFVALMRNFQGERLVGALQAVFGAERIVERTQQYLAQRSAFGRPIGKFQIWRHRVADWQTELAAARELTFHAVDLTNRGLECTREVSMAKLFAGETAVRVIDGCLQAHGGYGYSEEFPIARAYRDMRLVTIGAGTSEIMKEIISRFDGL